MMKNLSILFPAFLLGFLFSTQRVVGWSGIASCVLMVANDTMIDIPTTDNPVDQNYTLQAFEAVCNAKESFVDCVDKSLNSEIDDSMSLFKPLFDVKTVIGAYTGLCNNLTGVKDASHFSCLTNIKSLMPCYSQFNSYFEYLSVFMRLESGGGKEVVDAATRSFLCTLAKRRIECEVSVLKRCSVELGDIMGTFYERSLPSACNDTDDQGKVMPTVS